jgi:hypothetical protein
MEFIVINQFVVCQKRCFWAVANLQEGKNAVFRLLQTCRKEKTLFLGCCKLAGRKKRRFLAVANLQEGKNAVFRSL